MEKAKKEWFPYDEYKKKKEEKYRQTNRGYYQKEQPTPDKKLDFESILNRLWKPLKKRNDTTKANVRNHQASINNIETQLGQLTKLVNERLPPRNPDPKSKPHVMPIYTEKKLMIHDKATKKPNSYLEEEKPEAQKEKFESHSDDSAHRGDLVTS